MFKLLDASPRIVVDPTHEAQSKHKVKGRVEVVLGSSLSMQNISTYSSSDLYEGNRNK
jgi:hypothetical protein